MDTTAKARRLNNLPIRFQPPRDVINAMLDVIDAAEERMTCRSCAMCDTNPPLRDALARFREVADE